MPNNNISTGINNKLHSTESKIEKCAGLLKERNKTIALVESASAGFIASAFARAKNGGDILKGGIICYDVDVKEQLLKVPDNLIEAHSPESPEVTRAITAGLKSLITADYYIGITGLLRQGGSESPEKPVGTVFTCILSDGNEINDRALFLGEEDKILQNILDNIIQLIMHRLHSEEE